MIVKAPRYCRVWVAGLWLAASLPASAQQAPHVYTHVQHMPELPGGGGTQAIVAAIQKNIRYPADALRTTAKGRVQVSFVVTSTGSVQDVKVVQGLSPGCNQAAVEAVRQLPGFVPGRQNGQRVAVRLTLPVTFALAGLALNPVEPDPTLHDPDPIEEIEPGTQTDSHGFQLDSIGHVYTYIEQSPQLPGGGGMAAISASIERALVLPAGGPDGRVFVSFTVGPHGTVFNPKIVKGLSAGTDASVLAAVRRLPRFVPGRQNNRKVPFSFTAVAVRVPPLAPEPAGQARKQ